MRLRLPTPCDLREEPPLGAIVLLDVAAAVAAIALRARHIQIEGDFFDGETDEVTVARVLAHECDMLRGSLHEYRRLILARLAHARSRQPF